MLTVCMLYVNNDLTPRVSTKNIRDNGPPNKALTLCEISEVYVNAGDISPSLTLA